MSDNPLVTLITPAYNVGSYIHRLLDSVLMQDYDNIEMLVVDDGSTDDTAEVVKRYINKFRTKGYQLSYIYQENSGQSVALNSALKLINGKYFCWPDSDDYYSTPAIISSLVNTIENIPEEYSMVRSLQVYVSEEDLSPIGKTVFNADEELFYDCLYRRNGFWFAPGGFMLRTGLLDQLIPGREIYTEKDAGQNWQILLPYLYGFKCRTINMYGQNILVRESSHSRGQYQNMKLIDKINSYHRTLDNTISNLPGFPEKEREKILLNLRRKYMVEKLSILTKYGTTEDIRKLMRDYLQLCNHKTKEALIIRFMVYRLKYNRIVYLFSHPLLSVNKIINKLR